MNIPDYQSLMLPVLEEANSGEIKVSTAISRIAERLHLSEEQRSLLLPSGKQAVFANRVHWAKTYLAKAGLIEITKRGYFKITKKGKMVLDSDPGRIDNEFLDQYAEFAAFRRKSASPPDGHKAGADKLTRSAQTPDEVMREAYGQVKYALKQELLERIIVAPPEFFERLIIQLLVAMGYGGTATDPGRVLGRSGDGGIDGVIDQDALGLDRVYIQAKRFKPGNTIGSAVIREFFGSLDRFKAAKGVLVTTSTFSKEAHDTASYMSKRIVLIDGDRLTDLMILYNVGCRIKEVLHIKDVDEDFFSE